MDYEIQEIFNEAYPEPPTTLVEAVRNLNSHMDKCNKAFEKGFMETNRDNYEKFRDDVTILKNFSTNIKVEEYWERGMVTLQVEMRCKW